ncbi:MAG: hypothetical protein M3014_02115 [Chloroflexota bacterium]|nr:hypothetical protein [Chloroflexota bacterium]
MGNKDSGFRRFAVLSGVRQEADDLCHIVRQAQGERRGTLVTLCEPAGDHPSLGGRACRVAQEELARAYFSNTSLSITTALLDALDHTNSELLHYNFGGENPQQKGGNGSVAVQSGGIRTRGAKVGMTAVLLRPDDEGMYLAQFAPTQAYILHKGMLNALPEPHGWRGAGAPFPELLEEPAQDERASPTVDTAKAPPLGSSPGIEMDLIFRRVEKGDLLVMVSSSLARHLDYEVAQEIFGLGDPEKVIEALYLLATDKGLAQAHAAVLEIGALITAGSTLETSIGGHTAPEAMSVTTNGGVRRSIISAKRDISALKDAAQNPRNWLHMRRKEEQPQSSDNLLTIPVAGINAEHDISALKDAARTPRSWLHVRHREEQPQSSDSLLTIPVAEKGEPRTKALLQRTVETPPYRAPQLFSAEDMEEESHFDGWEDRPPALLKRQPHESKQVAQSSIHITGHTTGHATGAGRHLPDYIVGTSAPEWSPQPTHSVEHLRPVESHHREISQPKQIAAQVQEKANKVLGGVVHTLHAMLPEKQAPIGVKKRAISTKIPLQAVIGAGLVLLLLALAFSIYTLTRNSKSDSAKIFLDEAKQQELQANQPSLTVPQQLQGLTVALDKAKKAHIADPRSAEAGILVSKINGELDKLQGVTRLAEPKLLFNLDDVDKGGRSLQELGAQASAAPVTATATLSSSRPGALGSVLVQSNDAFILDRQNGKVYRCRISAQSCAVVLKEGDTAGGQKVTEIIGMTLRVGSLVVLDKALVAYSFNADTSAWQAETLGGAAGLQKPSDVASYDGNLYLLNAKPNQISRYASGKYGAGGEDWLKEGTEQVKEPVSMAIDGAIYVLLGDGKVLVLQGGKISSTIASGTPTNGTVQASPGSLYTSTDTKDLYILSAQTGTVTRMSKEGQVVARYKGPADNDRFSTLGAMTVDEGKGKLYLLAGRQLFEAALQGHSQGASENLAISRGVVAAPVAPASQPAVRPTAEP